jgi:hypothetical protein
MNSEVYDPMHPTEEDPEDFVLGDIHGVNPRHYRDGCSNLVAADFLGVSIEQFNSGYGLTMLARNAEQITNIYTFARISSLDGTEIINGKDNLFRYLKGFKGVRQFAVGWSLTGSGGHVIRCVLNNGRLKFWDPQALVHTIPNAETFVVWTLGAQ